MKSGQGQHALCLGWKWCGNFHLVGLSAVSKQCKRDLREARSWRTLVLSSARWESSGERHYQLFLQGIQTHSRESLAHPEMCNSSKMTLWWMLQPLFPSCPSPPGKRKWSHFHAECRDGTIPPACVQGVTKQSQSLWVSLKYRYLSTNGWGKMKDFTIVLQLFARLKSYINFFLDVIRLVLRVRSMK